MYIFNQYHIYTDNSQNNPHELNVVVDATVQQAINYVAQAENIPAEELSLVSEGSLLEPTTALIQYEGKTLELHSRLVGGKVHGSLSRAGKVKGQTPKVEKQDKKKAKTGRAKRRFQYNRRFVNVVQGFGKKRGPNSNQS